MVNQADKSGNFLNSNGEIKNIVDILLEKGATDNPLYTDNANTLNRQPAITGNMVASNGKVYNIVDLISSVNISEGAVTAGVIATEGGSNCQAEIDALKDKDTTYENDITTLNTTVTRIISGDYIGAEDASINLTKSRDGVLLSVDVFGIDFGAENAGKTLKVGESGFLELSE